LRRILVESPAQDLGERKAAAERLVIVGGKWALFRWTPMIRRRYEKSFRPPANPRFFVSY